MRLSYRHWHIVLAHLPTILPSAFLSPLLSYCPYSQVPRYAKGTHSLDSIFKLQSLTWMSLVSQDRLPTSLTHPPGESVISSFNHPRNLANMHLPTTC